MSSALMSLVADLPPGPLLAGEILLKSTLLIAGVWLLNWLVGRKRLRLQAALWNLCLVGLALLPVAVMQFPSLTITSPLGRIRDNTISSTARDTVEALAAPAFVASNQSRDQPPDQSALSEAAIVDAPQFAPTDSIDADTDRDAIAVTPVATRWSAGTVFVAAGCIYLLILGVMLMRLVASLFAVAGLRRESIPISSGTWPESLDRWRKQIGITSSVALRQSDRVGVPAVIGWRHPTILLSANLAEATDKDVIDAVLLHELAHIERGDYAWNLLLQVVRAVYWPQPCAWLVSHYVRAGREAVCDAVCMHWMDSADRYPNILVEIAASLMPRSHVALGMSMASASKLAVRLSRIADCQSTPRGLLPRPARTAVATLVIVAVGILGSSHFVSCAAAVDRADLPATREDPADASQPAPAEQPAEKSVSEAPALPEPPGQANADPRELPLLPSEPIKVKVATVKRAPFEKSLRFLTSLEATGQISIPARSLGTVAKVLVEEGDAVKKGDELAQLDMPNKDAEIAETEAALVQAKAEEERALTSILAAETDVKTKNAEIAAAAVELRRAKGAVEFRKTDFAYSKRLVDTKVISDSELGHSREKLENAEEDVAIATAKLDASNSALTRAKVEVQLAKASTVSAKADVAAVEARLKRIRSTTEVESLTIRSPIDGIVLESNIEPGSSIQPAANKPLFRLARADQIMAVIAIPQSLALDVKAGDPATVRLEALRQQPPIEARVNRIGNSINSSTGTLRGEIQLANSKGLLKPGMSGEATVITMQVPDALSIPLSALYSADRFRGEGGCVRIVKGRAVRTTVKLGQTNNNAVEILDGLAPGDLVIDDINTLEPTPVDGQEVDFRPPNP